MGSSHIAAVIACRVLGLYVALSWLGLLPTAAFSFLKGPPFTWRVVGDATMLAAPLALAIALWRLSPWIAKHMIPKAEGMQSPPPITLNEAQSAAISVLGLFFIAAAVPGIVIELLEYLRLPELAEDPLTTSYLNSGILKGLVMRLVELLMGMCLFWGAPTFTRLSGIGGSKRDVPLSRGKPEGG